jgi:hypothetical protein
LHFVLESVIENKLGLKNLVAKTKESVKFDAKSIVTYAANGALYSTGANRLAL